VARDVAAIGAGTEAQQVENLRYGRLKICATWRGQPVNTRQQGCWRSQASPDSRNTGQPVTAGANVHGITEANEENEVLEGANFFISFRFFVFRFMSSLCNSVTNPVTVVTKADLF
jgi:hypothetical protein